MRLRIYKRKVLALLLALGAAAACALTLWGSGGGGRPEGGEAFTPHSPSFPGTRGLLLPPPLPHLFPHNASAFPPPPPSKPPREEEDEDEDGLSLLSGPNATLRLRSLIYRLNFDQPLRNAHKWRPLTADHGNDAADTGAPWVALVVQVHSRPEHLSLLLGSLRQAKGVERVLLVLSHDVWSPELNALASAVDFCAVLQIFFPFSLQLYPEEFPGPDPRDCPRDLGRAAALQRGCLNARFPDSFGHYREAAFAQAKHHWWWKLHFAWERLRALRGLPEPGLLLFLEEDHFLAPDALHVLRRLWDMRQRECPECQVLSLGSYAAVRADDADFAAKARAAELKTWKSTEHNMGLAFPRETYRQLAACSEAFCAYDDYNWDWTLQHLTVGCLPRFWKVLLPQVPRVFHTGGDCGMHHSKKKDKAAADKASAACHPAAQIRKVEALLAAHRDSLFPEAMALSKRFPLAPLSPHVKNGGWGDIRDHELCKSYQRLQ
ncbi:alpha-1,6-mannosyl-glycoprotein 2-beta-N-acetylglucosaminyltransferase [Anolis sagrei]|uniref:alpha-1,6-mannosyl-glycoprotein 2-beta-N-acetylglucosaminyltransferase n=1 Tax=Anolis sagrei TaxID=38937 RepID=UPI00352009EA